jgi:hypothetical protein
METGKGSIFLTLIAAMGLVLATAPALAEYPSARQAEIARTGKYVGGDACKTCHSDIHGKWATSWHTKKTEWGPAHPDKYRMDKIYPWVVRDWDKLDTYMILDRKDRTTNYIAVDKVPLKQIDFVVGGQRKQRYATYYDGGSRKAWLATTEDGGISWKLDKSTVHDFPGNKERAGYKFLLIEVRPKDGDLNRNYYGEFRSWQERCIFCHTTGFDYQAWDAAKADFIAGKRKDLREIFVADIRVSCEACHGPGAVHVENPSWETIINPARITDVEMRKMVCEQCHTRTQASTKGKGANDLRGYRLTERYADFADYTRPAWGKGNRQVSIDGKGRRDHQQDMDMRLSTTVRGPHSVHADMACFDCHEAHSVGNDPENPRLKLSRIETCAACHGAKAEAVLTALDGRKGWQRAGYPDWRSEYGREANKQHIFNLDAQGRAYGVTPAQYHWALKKGGNPKKEADWESIWPWEKADFEAKGLTVAIGAAPWNQ